MRDVITRLKLLGAHPKSLKLLAGGSRSRLSAQLRADISALPVFLPQHPHSSVIGAAMLAGVASGTFTDVRQAAAHLAPPSQCLTPNAATTLTLDSFYERYRQLFAAVKSFIPATRP
jgi:xylulokinase